MCVGGGGRREGVGGGGGGKGRGEYFQPQECPHAASL